MAIQNVETKPPETATAEELEINELTAKATPADADIALLEDSADTFAKKKTTWANIKAALKTYFDTLYLVIINTLTAKATPADSDIVLIEDSADTFAKKKLTWANIKSTLKSYFDTFYLTRKGILHLVASGYSPLDSTTYYFGNYTTVPQSFEPVARFYIPFACTIKSIYLGAFMYTTAASAENVSVYIRVNNTTDTTLSTTWQWNVVNTDNLLFVSGLSLALSAGDFISIKIVTPAFATNPATTYHKATIYYET